MQHLNESILAHSLINEVSQIVEWIEKSLKLAVRQELTAPDRHVANELQILDDSWSIVNPSCMTVCDKQGILRRVKVLWVVADCAEHQTIGLQGKGSSLLANVQKHGNAFGVVHCVQFSAVD